MSDIADKPSPSGGGNCVAIGCLVVAALLYLFSFGGTIESGTHNPEDGMLVGFVMIAEVGLWIALGLFVLLSCVRAEFSPMLLAATVLVVALAGFASVAAFAVMGTDPNWISLTPILLPPLAAAFGFRAARTPSAAASGRGTLLLFAAGALLLCLPPAIGHAVWVSEAPQREAARAEDERRIQAEIAATTARYRALNPDSPIEAYVDFLNQSGLYRDEALAALRALPGRQAGAIRMLDAGRMRDLAQLHEFELEPDAALCASYSAAVDRIVAGYRLPSVSGDAVVGDFYDQIPNIGWLTARGCDLSAPLNRLFDVIRRMPEASRPSFLIDQIGPLAARGGGAGR